MFVLFASIKLVALSCYLVLVLLTLRSKAERNVRVLFSIYLLGMLLWQLGSVIVNFTGKATTALFLYNLLIASSGMYTILFFPFTRALLNIKRQRLLTVLAYAACAVQFLSGIAGLQLHDVSLGRGGYWVPVYNSTLLFALSGLSFFFWGCGFFNLVRGIIREHSPVQRNRIFYVLLGASVVILGASTNLIGLRDYPVDISANLVSALVIGYAVVRYRLLDIRVILVRSLFYSILTAALAAVYLGIIYGLENLLKMGIGYTGPAYGLVAIFLLAVVFLPLRNSLQKGLDRLFFREKADYQKVTQSFSRDITSHYDLDEILNLVGGTVVDTIKSGTISISLLDEGRREYAVRKTFGIKPGPVDASFSDRSGLVRWLRREGKPLVREEALLEPGTRHLVAENASLFETASVSVIVPILLKDRLTGTINLGQKLSGAMYNTEDLRFLTTIANQTAAAIEKSIVYGEIQRRLSGQTLLFILSEKFRGTMDFDSIMGSIVDVLKDFLSCDHCALVYFGREGKAKGYAADDVSVAAAAIASEPVMRELMAGGGPDGRLSADARQALRDPLRRTGITASERELVASMVYLPLENGDETLGVLVLPDRTAGGDDARERELLRTIRAIISQGIVLYHTIVNLMSVKTYNENILNSLNDMGDLLVILDLDGRIRRVNRATCQRLGYREDELLGRGAGLIVGGGESLFAGAGFRRLIEAGTVAGYEMAYCTRDGTAIPMLVSGSVVTGEDGLTREIVCIGRDLSEHLKAEEMAKNLLLVQEIHHRIKNNLQVISSLLYLQSGHVQDAKTREMFKESQNRVRSMALLHEKLYQSRAIAGIHFSEYVRDLTRTLFGSYGVEGTTVRVTYAVEDITLGMDTAVPCGLIINELVSNALKHAFPLGRTGEVRIEMAPVPGRDAPPGEHGAAERWYQLSVSDDGKGFPEGLDFRRTDSLGLKLVCTLTEQLFGTISLQRDPGTRFLIKFREL